jgi:predicted  nucleic acid-binding Zn-ribbon protein
MESAVATANSEYDSLRGKHETAAMGMDATINDVRDQHSRCEERLAQALHENEAIYAQIARLQKEIEEINSYNNYVDVA